MSGQLWLKLLEARDLPAVDGKSSDPKVIFKLPDGHKLTSKSIDKNLNPIWNEEYIINVADRNAKITCDVKDHNTILSDKAIGVTEIELSKLSDNVVHDIWLPVKGSKTSDKSQVHFLARYAPINVAGIKFKSNRLPSFRMQLERRTYFPGELVRGHIIFNVGQPKKIRGVRVKFLGYEDTCWTETRHVVHSDGTSGTEIVPYTAHHTFFNPIATLFGNERGSSKDFKISSNSYLWPFEFCLPLNLPPSYRHALGSIRYAVEGYVDIPWAADKIVKMPIDIIVSYTSLNLWHPTMKMSKKTKGHGKTEFGSIDLVAATKDVAYIGEPQSIDLSVTNNTNRFISALKCELKYKQKFIAFERGGGHAKDKKDSHKVLQVTVPAAIAPGTQWNGNVSITIPVDSPISVLKQLSPFIRTKYELEIEAVSDSGKMHSGVEFELIVGVRHPAEWVPPTHCLGNPNQVQLVRTDAIPAQAMQSIMAPPPMTAEVGQEQFGFVGAVLPPSAYQQNAYQPEQYADPKDPASNPYAKPVH